ncbi:MAG: hypothetical protein AB1673_13050 [Actinomycetota bacterium]
MGAVLGDHRADLEQLDRLAGRELARRAVPELGPAIFAALRPVVDDLVGLR